MRHLPRVIMSLCCLIFNTSNHARALLRVNARHFSLLIHLQLSSTTWREFTKNNDLGYHCHRDRPMRDGSRIRLLQLSSDGGTSPRPLLPITASTLTRLLSLPCHSSHPLGISHYPVGGTLATQPSAQRLSLPLGWPLPLTPSRFAPTEPRTLPQRWSGSDGV